MNSHPPEDSLLDLLAVALRDEPPPEAVRLALGAPVLVGAREQLAHRDYDSFLDDDAVLLRSNLDNMRAASFTHDGVTVDFEILDDGSTIVGQVLPAAKFEVDVVQFAGTRQVRSDARGRFRSVVRPGPVQLRLRGENGRLSTPWLSR